MSVYSTIPIKRPKRSVHNLSHSVRTTCNIGELIPIARPIEVVPGDKTITSNISTVELQPLVSPFKGDLYWETWQFFVSNDSLYSPTDSDKFTKILSSINDPQNALPLPYISGTVSKKSIYSYYGIPVGTSFQNLKVPVYPHRAYYSIWNEYFRDENLQSEASYGSSGSILKVNYKKDRFTSAFKSPQKGNPPTFSIGKYAVIKVSNLADISPYDKPNLNENSVPLNVYGVADKTGTNINISSGGASALGFMNLRNTTTDTVNLQNLSNSAVHTLYADLSQVSALTINDLRLMNKLQKWQERNQLCGSERIKEYLLANYGVAPNDETLNRPVLIGHTKVPVIVNSVVSNIKADNTSSSVVGKNYSGSKAGTGSTISQYKYGSWTVKEFGWIITLGALRPKASYVEGVHRSLIKKTVYDYFNPMFESLGQEEIYKCELYGASSDPMGVFGFTDRYNSMRHLEDMTTGLLAPGNGLESWSVNRYFGSQPTLSSEFITVNATEYDYLFSVKSTVSDQAIITSNNIVKAIRPISKYAHPSL